MAKIGNEVYFLNPPIKDIQKNYKLIMNIDKGKLYVVDYVDIIKGKRFMPSFVNGKIFKLQLNIIEKWLGIDFDILWNFESSRFFNMSYLKKDILKILHLVDYNTIHNLKLAAKTADICFCTTEYIKNELLKYNKNTYKINHGWQGPTKSKFVTQLNSNKIKIGYLGNLTIKYIDWNLITQIIKQNQNIDFYFFGPKNSNHLSPTNKLSDKIIYNILNYKNVKLFGAISSDKIHGYLTQMDANIITYTADQNQKQLSNPHKIMEYLGSGKIIISTYTSEFKDKNEMIKMSTINSDYLELFNHVINNLEKYNSLENRNKRIKYAHNHLYEQQLDKIFTKIKCFTQ